MLVYEENLTAPFSIAVSQIEDERILVPWGHAGQLALLELVHHIRHVLSNGHALLGRVGPVCPFARGALRGDHIRLMVSLAEPDQDSWLRQEAMRMRSVFKRLTESIVDPAQRIFATVVLALPAMNTPAGAQTICRVQKALKSECVARGIMIGQFYPGCTEAGLHNPAFRPLDTPVTFLAMRQMTVQDAPFLLDEPEFERHFVARFGSQAERSLAVVRKRSLSPEIGA